MAWIWAASRPHRVTVWRAAALTASAVPQAPAPSTQILIGACAGGLLRDDRRGLRRGLRLLLLEHRLEVDFGQVHRREAAALDHVGNVAAQVRIDDLRAGDAEDRAHLVFGQ